MYMYQFSKVHQNVGQSNMRIHAFSSNRPVEFASFNLEDSCKLLVVTCVCATEARCKAHLHGLPNGPCRPYHAWSYHHACTMLVRSMVQVHGNSQGA